MNKPRIGIATLSAVLCLLAVPVAEAATADKFSAAENIVCPGPDKAFTFDKNKGQCLANSAEIEKIPPGECSGPGLEPKDKGPSKVCAASSPAPSPTCKDLAGGYTAKLNGSAPNMTCAYERTLTSSSPGDYIGDCFGISAVPSGTQLAKGKTYIVTRQRNTESDDRDLTVVPGRIWWFPLRCKPVDGEIQHVLASQLTEAGAARYGYAYGFLTMPYKYFPGQKSFQVNVPIGAYLGWRAGRVGSGVTTAVALTLSNVKANTVDPNTLDASGKPTVTGSTDVAALSGAVGVMFDILKSPSGKPFKAGMFVGKDVVNEEPTISYKFNRKTWIAIQIGYDFTD